MSDPSLFAVLVPTALAAVFGLAALGAIFGPVAPEDRRWRDRPPLYWRLTAPLTRRLASLVAPSLPGRLQGRASRLLRHAGLDYALDAPQLVAGCLLAGVLAGGLVTVGLQAGADWVALRTLSGTVAAARSATPAVPWQGGWLAPAVAALAGAWMPWSWVSERRAVRSRAIARALPFYLDVITLSVESGANLTGALQHAVSKGPAGPLQAELERVLRDMRAGRSRPEALRALAERLESASVSSWVAALISAERNGSSLGPILRAQAEQRRQERFQRAEKLAMKAPVKMLFPLLLFIFPCTFVLLFFPVVVRLFQEGLLR